MQADYVSLIEKHQLEGLGMIRQADTFANRLLSLNPDAADAYLTLGFANYIIGNLPGIKRFFLRFKGIGCDKNRGLQQLEIALAMAPVREKQFGMARNQLVELVAEFPRNPLFAQEVAKLDAAPEAVLP